MARAGIEVVRALHDALEAGAAGEALALVDPGAEIALELPGGRRLRARADDLRAHVALARGARVRTRWLLDGGELAVSSLELAGGAAPAGLRRAGAVWRADGLVRALRVLPAAEPALAEAGLADGVAVALDRIAAGFDHMNAGDYAAASRGLAPDIEWRVPELPGEEVHRGVEAVRGFWQSYREAWGAWRMDVRSFRLGAPGRVVVHVRMAVRGQTSGLPLAGELFLVWSLRGAQVTRVETFTDRDEALAAAG